MTISPLSPDDEAHIRQETICGAAPRIAPLPSQDIGPQGVAIVRNLREAAGLPDASEIPEMVSTLLRHPGLYEKHAAVGAEILGHGVLDKRHRELAILRTGWLCGAPFEWGEHVVIARRVGLSGLDIARITEGSIADGWLPDDRSIVAAAEELHRDAMISDAIWEKLAAFLNDRQLIELVYIIGHYTKVAFLQNALRLRLPPGNVGLAAR